MRPRATLDIDNCTALSDEFVAAIDDALQQPTVTDRFASLRQVFADFGTLYARTVVLGGAQYFTHEETVSGEVNETEVTTTVQAAVEIKAEGAAGKASLSAGEGEHFTSSAQTIAQHTNFTCIGGDTLLVGDPAGWAPTVKSPRNWRVIDRGDLRPVLERLDKTRQAAVTGIWDRGRSAAWGQPQANLPTEQDFPDADNRPFLLVNLGWDAPLRTDVLHTALLGTPAGGGPDFEYVTLPIGSSQDRVRQDKVCQLRLHYTGRTSNGGGSGLPLYLLASATGYPIDRSQHQIEAWEQTAFSMFGGSRFNVLGVTAQRMFSDSPHFLNMYSTRLSKPAEGGYLEWMLIPAGEAGGRDTQKTWYLKNVDGRYLAAFAEQRWAGAAGPPPTDDSARYWQWRIALVGERRT
jgi:hypothetical protein